MRVVVRGQFGVTVSSQLLSLHQRHAASAKLGDELAAQRMEVEHFAPFIFIGQVSRLEVMSDHLGTVAILRPSSRSELFRVAIRSSLLAGSLLASGFNVGDVRQIGFEAEVAKLVVEIR